MPICQEDSGWRKRCWGRHTATWDPAPDQLWATDQVMILRSSSWDGSIDFLAGLLVSPWWHTEHLMECHALVWVQYMEEMRLCVNPGNSGSSATDSIQQIGYRWGRELSVCSQARWTPYLCPSQSVTVLVLPSRRRTYFTAVWGTEWRTNGCRQLLQHVQFCLCFISFPFFVLGSEPRALYSTINLQPQLEFQVRCRSIPSNTG